MNADYFAQFYEACGYTILRTASSYWYNASNQIYQSIPPGVAIDPAGEELQTLFHRRTLLGVRFPSLSQSGVASGLFVVRDKQYDFHSLQRQFRQHVQKGFEYGEINEIDFDYLFRHGMPVNQEAIARRGQKLSHFVALTPWRRFCEAGKRTPGTGVIGSFVRGELVSYLVYFIADKICHGLYMMSRTAARSYRANHLLYYVYTKTMIARTDIEVVTTGLQSPPALVQVDEFKRHAGYHKEPRSLCVAFRPAAQLLLLNRATGFALDLGERIVGANGSLQKLHRLLQMAKATQLGPVEPPGSVIGER